MVIVIYKKTVAGHLFSEMPRNRLAFSLKLLAAQMI